MSVPEAKCLVACAGQDQHLVGTVAGSTRADLRKPPVHVERQRIPCLRSVEGDPADAIADLVKEVGVQGRGVIHGASRLLRVRIFR
jgi:hypothetical protein